MKRLLALLALVALSTMPAAASWYFAPDVPTVLTGTTYQPWNIVLKNGAGTYSLALSLPVGASIDGLHHMNGGDWLLSVGTTTNLGGTDYDPRDVIRFDGIGSYTVFFSGAAAGVPAGCNVDAAFLDGDDTGDLVLSFDVPATIGAATYEPADLVRFSGGTFSLFFDASAATPPIPSSTNVTGAGRQDALTLLTFDVPTALGLVTYLPGQIVAWSGTSFTLFSTDSAWPISSRVNAFATAPSAQPGGSSSGQCKGRICTK
jgi:hypothetical protein